MANSAKLEQPLCAKSIADQGINGQLVDTCPAEMGQKALWTPFWEATGGGRDDPPKSLLELQGPKCSTFNWELKRDEAFWGHIFFQDLGRT